MYIYIYSIYIYTTPKPTQSTKISNMEEKLEGVMEELINIKKNL